LQQGASLKRHSLRPVAQFWVISDESERWTNTSWRVLTRLPHSNVQEFLVSPMRNVTCVRPVTAFHSVISTTLTDAWDLRCFSYITVSLPLLRHSSPWVKISCHYRCL
jgi:hypothetical protein